MVGCTVKNSADTVHYKERTVNQKPKGFESQSIKTLENHLF